MRKTGTDLEGGHKSTPALAPVDAPLLATRAQVSPRFYESVNEGEKGTDLFVWLIQKINLSLFFGIAIKIGCGSCEIRKQSKQEKRRLLKRCRKRLRERDA
jgi:hypothetical protein